MGAENGLGGFAQLVQPLGGEEFLKAQVVKSRAPVVAGQQQAGVGQQQLALGAGLTGARLAGPILL